jgi:hypothetical protein
MEKKMHKFAALALILATVVAFPTMAEAKIDIAEGPIVSCCYDDGR